MADEPCQIKISQAVEHSVEALQPSMTHSSFESYRSYCRAFARWAGKGLVVADITTELLDAYFALLMRLQPGSSSERVLRPRTIRSYWNAISKLCKWLTANTHDGKPYLTQNPFPTRKLPKLDAAIRPRTSEADAFAMLEACQQMEDAHRRALTRCVIYLLFTGVMRKSEMLQIRMEHLYLDQDPPHILVFYGKGGKQRKCIPPDDCLQAVREYLKLRPANAEHDYFLCHNNRIWRLGEQCLYILLAEAERLAGLEPSKTHKPHAMRRGGARRMRKKGEDIETVQKRLGHSSVLITQMYTESDEDSMEQTRNLASFTQVTPPAPAPAPPATPPENQSPSQNSTNHGSDKPKPPRMQQDDERRKGAHTSGLRRIPTRRKPPEETDEH